LYFYKQLVGNGKEKEKKHNRQQKQKVHKAQHPLLVRAFVARIHSLLLGVIYNSAANKK